MFSLLYMFLSFCAKFLSTFEINHGVQPRIVYALNEKALVPLIEYTLNDSQERVQVARLRKLFLVVGEDDECVGDDCKVEAAGDDKIALCIGVRCAALCHGNRCYAESADSKSYTFCNGERCTSESMGTLTNSTCIGKDCTSECTGIDCHSQCEAESNGGCKANCLGANCASSCKGANCVANCGRQCKQQILRETVIGDSWEHRNLMSSRLFRAISWDKCPKCEVKCSGENCEALCHGNDCIASCEGRNCQTKCDGLNCKTHNLNNKAGKRSEMLKKIKFDVSFDI